MHTFQVQVCKDYQKDCPKSSNVRVGEVVTDLEEESCVVGFVHYGQGVVNVMLKGGVKPRMVGIRILEFITPVKIDSITYHIRIEQ